MAIWSPKNAKANFLQAYVRVEADERLAKTLPPATGKIEKAAQTRSWERHCQGWLNGEYDKN